MIGNRIDRSPDNGAPCKVFPRWSHSRNWGYAPSGGVGLVLLIDVVLVLLGQHFNRRASPNLCAWCSRGRDRSGGGL